MGYSGETNDISGTTAFYGFLAKVIIYNHVIIQVGSIARKS
jgi:hypothetical protein